MAPRSGAGKTCVLVMVMVRRLRLVGVLALALARDDHPAAMQALHSPIFTLGPERTLAILKTSYISRSLTSRRCRPWRRLVIRSAVCVSGRSQGACSAELGCGKKES